MADISRDTFDSTKLYRKVIFQQGKLWVDADQNESQDILWDWLTKISYALSNHTKARISDGTDDGFKVVGGSGDNTVIVKKGDILIDGIIFQLSADSVQSNFLGQENDPQYIWIRYYFDEIDSTEDPNLINMNIGVETSRRLKLVWNFGIGTSVPVDTSTYKYRLIATISRDASGQTEIHDSDITQNTVVLGSNLNGDYFVSGDLQVGTTVLKVTTAGVGINTSVISSLYKLDVRGNSLFWDGTDRTLDIDISNRRAGIALDRVPDTTLEIGGIFRITDANGKVELLTAQGNDPWFSLDSSTKQVAVDLTGESGGVVFLSISAPNLTNSVGTKILDIDLGGSVFATPIPVLHLKNDSSDLFKLLSSGEIQLNRVLAWDNIKSQGDIWVDSNSDNNIASVNFHGTAGKISFYTSPFATDGVWASEDRFYFSRKVELEELHVRGASFIVQEAQGGRIGLRTDTPQYPIDVNGDTRISGNLTVTGSVMARNDPTIVGITIRELPTNYSEVGTNAGNARIHLMPMEVGFLTNIEYLYFCVQAVGTDTTGLNYGLGIYDDSGTLIADTGMFAIGSTGMIGVALTNVVSLQVGPTMYWLCFAVNQNVATTAQAKIYNFGDLFTTGKPRLPFYFYIDLGISLVSLPSTLNFSQGVTDISPVWMYAMPTYESWGGGSLPKFAS